MSDEKKIFTILRENSSIICFKFTALNSRAGREWGEYVKKYDGHYPDPLRILYDFTACKDAPSRYFLKLLSDLMPTLALPKNSRYAYLLPNQGFSVWANAFFNPTVERGQSRSFLSREEAVNWLMQGLSSPEEAPKDSTEEDSP
jgi:hypothetical protein